MASPSKLLRHYQVQQINDALASAGESTSARIAPVVAASSGRYERSEDLLGLWASAMGLALVWWLVATNRLGKGQINSDAAIASGLLLVLAVVATGFILGGLLSSHIGWLRRLFIPRRQLKVAVRERAELLLRECSFHAEGEKDGPHVLIFVSLYERGAEILAAEPLAQQLPPQAMEPIRQVLIDGLAGGRVSESLCQAIDMLKDLLAPICPPAASGEPGERPRLRLID